MDLTPGGTSLQALIAAADTSAIISRYPVRETPALDRVATTLGFQGRTQYEAAVRKLLMDDKDTLQTAMSLFGTLGNDIRIH